MRFILTVLVVTSIAGVALAEDEKPLLGWVYPQAGLKELVSQPVTVTSADKKKVQSITTGFGQYVTDDPFHEVVKFYVDKSGLKPPNWSILGREFPGTDIHMPAHFSETNMYRETPGITVLHYIREEVATTQFLITDEPQVGFMSISITRGKDDSKTLIQIIQHPSKRIERGK